MEFEKAYAVSDGERMIRQRVFVDEQGYENEFDEIDGAPGTCHILALLEGVPAGCCRVFPEGPGQWRIGRVAVLPEFRRRGIASALLKEAEDYLRAQGAKSVRVGAQCTAEPLYRRSGYVVCGSIFYDEKTPHVPMIKNLDGSSPAQPPRQ
ncbi:MAG: GNAT family N-acetyltransferase [Pyramidobacter sp.]|jgi:predicted GNAT family N-acyltransferase